MPEYDVVVVRRMNQYQQIRVSAATPQEATSLAEDRLEEDQHWVDQDEIPPDVAVQALSAEVADD